MRVKRNKSPSFNRFPPQKESNGQTGSRCFPKAPYNYIIYITLSLLSILLMCIFLNNFMTKLIQFETIEEKLDKPQRIDDHCQIELVESIPEGLIFKKNSPKFKSTYEAWKTLLDMSEESLDIGSFYWTLRGVDVINHTSANLGEDIFDSILAKGLSKSIKIRIAQSQPSKKEPDNDTKILQEKEAAEVRSLDFSRLIGAGILHTKFWIADRKHIYLGSANMDWRSLTQVKEMGVLAINCSTLATDLSKIFEEYWLLATPDSQIPKQWPSQYATKFNFNNPMILEVNSKYKQLAFLSSSPPPLTADGRVDDVNAILNVIGGAQKYINIAVMDYFPLMIYERPYKYWPVIDDALRKAAIDRKVKIKLLISWWRYSNPSEDYFLASLEALSTSLPGVDIQIKRFIVPMDDDQEKIPYGRVNHNKYMVTDNVAYIGTSNWSGDYFTNTAGVGLVMPDTPETLTYKNSSIPTIRKDLLSVFMRDWESDYAVDIMLTP